MRRTGFVCLLATLSLIAAIKLSSQTSQAAVDAGGRIEAKVVRAALAPLMALPDKPASYVSETDFFQKDWQTAFWGDHYTRLKQIKRRYDPDGLFFVHHSVGSESWSPDGFTRI